MNLDDGSVLSIDLRTVDGLRLWRERSLDPGFSMTVRGVSLALGDHRADLPLPRRFRELSFSAEVIRDRDDREVAERVSVHADGVVLSLTLHLNGRSGRFRVDLDKRGRPRFRPESLR